jgi:hypothetical protein
MPLTMDSIVVASPRQVSSVVGSETVILELEKGVYFSLADTGSRIWELLQEPRPIAEIREVIVEEYEVGSVPAAADLLSLLGEMRDRGLVEVRGGEAQ